MRRQVFCQLMLNTFQKEYRNKVLIFLFIFNLLLILFINGLVDFFMEPLQKSQAITSNVLDAKLTAFSWVISTWGGMLALLLGVNCIRSDFELKVASQILTFPIKRLDYILSRILGTWLIVIGFYALSLICAYGVFSVTDGQFTFGLSIITGPMVGSLTLLVTITLGALVSLYFSKLLSFLGGLFIKSMIILSNSFFLHKEDQFFKNVDQGIFYKLGIFLHYFFPRVGLINDYSNALFFEKSFEMNYAWEGLHFVLSYGLLLGVLIAIFYKKEHDY